MFGSYFFEKVRIVNIDNGVWLSDGVEGCTFLSSKDSLTHFSSQKLTCICGKVKESFLVVSQGYFRSITDLSQSPYYVLKENINI